MSQFCGSLSGLASRSGVTSAASAGNPAITTPLNSAEPMERECFICLLLLRCVADPMQFQFLGRINGSFVPGQRVNADHALGAVEQGGKLAARRLVAEFLDAIADVCRRVTHDVEPLLDLEQL